MRLAYSRPGGADEFLEMAGLAGDFGFEAVQPKGGQFTPWRDADDPPPVPNVMGVIAYGADEGATDATLRWAARHDVEVVTWVAGWKPDEVTREQAAQILTRLGIAARAKGTPLSLHHHAGAVFESADDIAYLRDGTRPADVKLTLDTAHAALGGITDIAQLIRDCAKIIDVFHIKALSNGAFCPLGRGELDFAPIFEAIADIQFSGWLVIDDESDDMDTRSALAHARAFLAAHT
ncbi:MAG: TIM barrel protein [Candidatus Poribacteria bacterium]